MKKVRAFHEEHQNFESEVARKPRKARRVVSDETLEQYNLPLSDSVLGMSSVSYTHLQFKVFLCNLEAVRCRCHCLKAFVFLVLRKEYAITLKAAAPDTTAKLMQLCQSEPLGVFDDDYGRVRNIDTDLYNCLLYTSRCV